MKFRKGSSGSSKHTESYGPGPAGAGTGGTVGKPEDGPRIGPGKFARRVTPEIGTSGGSRGAAGKPGKAYNEE